MKIYAVTDGSYSDYRVLGIYSTEENAKWAHKLYAADNEIEEYELDGLPDAPPGLLRYELKMDVDGHSSDIKLKSARDSDSEKWRPTYTDDDETVTFDVWAENETHAVKIANEMRVQLIATNQWTTNYDTWCDRKVS